MESRHLLISSLGQHINVQFGQTLTALSRLTSVDDNPRFSSKDVNAWLLTQLRPLHLEDINFKLEHYLNNANAASPLASPAVKQFHANFNCEFFTDHGYPETDYNTQFLPAFLSMCTLSERTLERIFQEFELILKQNHDLRLEQKPELEILLLTHLDNVHLLYIFQQMTDHLSSHPKYCQRITTLLQKKWPESKQGASSDALNLINQLISVRDTPHYDPNAIIKIASSMGMKIVDDNLLFENVFNQYGTPINIAAITSFLDTITHFKPGTSFFEKYGALTYRYPGKSQQFFHEFLCCYSIPSKSNKQVFMALGDFVVQDKKKTLFEFVTLIRYFYRLDKEALTHTLMKLITEQEKPAGLIGQLHQGNIEKEPFITELLKLVSLAIGVEPDAAFENAWKAGFKVIWNEMNPVFTDTEQGPGLKTKFHEAGLETARAHHHTPYQVRFVTRSNRFDIEHLTNVVRRADHAFTLENGELTQIMGYDLVTSFTVHQSEKHELVEKALSSPPKKLSYPSMFHQDETCQQKSVYLTSGDGSDLDLKAMEKLNLRIIKNWDKGPISRLIGLSLQYINANDKQGLKNNT